MHTYNTPSWRTHKAGNPLPRVPPPHPENLLRLLPPTQEISYTSPPTPRENPHPSLPRKNLLPSLDPPGNPPPPSYLEHHVRVSGFGLCVQDSKPQVLGPNFSHVFSLLCQQAEERESRRVGARLEKRKQCETHTHDCETRKRPDRHRTTTITVDKKKKKCHTHTHMIARHVKESDRYRAQQCKRKIKPEANHTHMTDCEKRTQDQTDMIARHARPDRHRTTTM